jgi:hypothetical protein
MKKERKKFKGPKKAVEDQYNTSMSSSFHIMGVPEDKEKGKGLEKFIQ